MIKFSPVRADGEIGENFLLAKISAYMVFTATLHLCFAVKVSNVARVKLVIMATLYHSIYYIDGDQLTVLSALVCHQTTLSSTPLVGLNEVLCNSYTINYTLNFKDFMHLILWMGHPAAGYWEFPTSSLQYSVTSELRTLQDHAEVSTIGRCPLYGECTW